MIRVLVPAVDEAVVHEGEDWKLAHEDCITHMATLPDECMDFSVYSPPFPALYAYTDKAADIGNSQDLKGETKLHLSFFYQQIRRLIKPGRVMMVHVAQIPRMKRAGGVGLFDFRGFNIRLAERAGFVFEYDWITPKNPQAQAIRTKSRELQFAGLESDRAKCRGSLPDYLLKFRVPGDNEILVDSKGEVSRNDWIQWAESAWYGIKETQTLNVKEGRGDDDVKHICPLQLEVINRLIRLYTNPGEMVFSPFTGIGSEGFEALKLGRQFYGCEIKDEYVEAAIVNFQRAINIRESSKQLPLFANLNGS